jgi:hypothetical protein
VIDSLSHAWMGKGGILEFVDNAAKRSQGNSYVGWRDATPLHNRLVASVLAYPGHVVVTLRSKMAYELVENSKGKKVPQKIGLQPIQRDGVEYEFDLICDVDLDHNLIVGKTRFSELDGVLVNKPGPEFGARILALLDAGESAPAPASCPPMGDTAPAPAPAKLDNRSWAEFADAAAEKMGSSVAAVNEAVIDSAIQAGYVKDGLRDNDQKNETAAHLFLTRKDWTRKAVIELVKTHLDEAAAHQAANQATPALAGV